MKNFKIIISLIFTIFIIISVTAENKGKQFLHTIGHDIIDKNGDKILLRGIGLGNWLLPEGYMWKFGQNGDRPRKIEKIVSDLIGHENASQFWKQFRKNYITDKDIKRIAELGFNSVRPALNARLFLTENDTAEFIEESFVLIDSLVTWCRKYNLYVIIDMHGAPGGQTGANIDDSPNNLPELFMDIKHQDRLVELWVKIAKRYANEPAVAAYDLLNEPLPHNTGAADRWGQLVEPLYKRIVKAIRKVDKNHMITLEGINWSNDWSIFGEPFDENVFYQFHYYCWNRPDNLNDITQYIEHRKRLNTPVWVGETGEKGNTIYWATTQYFESNNIGWSFWPWKKMDTKNTPYSIHKPTNWDQIAEYSRGGAKPSQEIAQHTFDELIENIILENCKYFEDVCNNIFRRVPVKIEAENYGHYGYNISYFVSDTSKRAKFYRVNEPVLIQLLNFEDNQFLSEQYIVLNSKEWVKYSFNNSQLETAGIKIKLKNKSELAEFEFSLNGNPNQLSITTSGWQEIIIPPTILKKDINQIVLKVTDGTICFDWIDILKDN